MGSQRPGSQTPLGDVRPDWGLTRPTGVELRRSPRIWQDDMSEADDGDVDVALGE